VEEEGGPLNRAPRLSILYETVVLQALSVYLQQEHDITPAQYVMWHPGGKLGELREDELPAGGAGATPQKQGG
jgi:D-arabinose 5-phosphate isomerase GutQ